MATLGSSNSFPTTGNREVAMASLEELVQAALGADEERKAAALRVLRGEAAEKDEGKRLKDEVEPYVSLREVSRRLGISTCSLWRYGVPSHSFAGRARFRMSEVEARLRELEEGRRTAKGAKDREGMK